MILEKHLESTDLRQGNVVTKPIQILDSFSDHHQQTLIIYSLPLKPTFSDNFIQIHTSCTQANRQTNNACENMISDGGNNIIKCNVILLEAIYTTDIILYYIGL